MQRLVLAMILAGMLWDGGRKLESRQAAAPAPTSYAGVEKTIASIRQGGRSRAPIRIPTHPAGMSSSIPCWPIFANTPRPRIRRAPGPAEPHLPDLDRAGRGPLGARASSGKSCGSGCARGFAWPGPSDGSTRRSAACRPRDPSIPANRQRWVDFVENDLGQALSQYDGAATVAQRQAGLKRVHEALRSLQTRNRSGPGSPRGSCRPRSTTCSTSPTSTSPPT